MLTQIAPDASIDLQMHTTYSDGRWTAEQLFDYLAKEKFTLVAVTDHDRVDTIDTVQKLGEQKGVAVLPAVEISAAWHGGMADVLCFGFDPHKQGLGTIASRTRRLQKENAEQVYAELLRRGYQFPRRESVLAARKGELRVPGDCARLLIEHGYAADWPAAFSLITEAGYHEIKADLAETVAAAHSDGGVALIAHPGRGLTEPQNFTNFTLDMLDQILAETPLDGIELYHPTHTPEQIKEYQAYVDQHNLLFSAGSDSHGHAGRMPIKHRADLCRRFFERLGIEVR